MFWRTAMLYGEWLLWCLTFPKRHVPLVIIFFRVFMTEYSIYLSLAFTIGYIFWYLTGTACPLGQTLFFCKLLGINDFSENWQRFCGHYKNQILYDVPKNIFSLSGKSKNSFRSSTSSLQTAEATAHRRSKQKQLFSKSNILLS